MTNRCRYPGARMCSCDSCHAEVMGVASARNNATYNGYANTLVEWMLSDAWTTYHGSTARGAIMINGIVFDPCNETSGEIPWK